MNSFSRSKSSVAAVVTVVFLTVLLSPHGYTFTNQYLFNGYQKINSITSNEDSMDGDSNPALPHHLQGDTPPTNPPQVAVVSMLYGNNDYYIRAINTHLRHAERFGYPSYILRTDIIDGVWNKLAYMLHVMITEIEKGDRGAKWLMWFDADSAVVNPALPLDIFLPPSDFDDIRLLATRDQSGFNAGMFLIRCHRWSVNLLTIALTLPKYKPDVVLAFAEQSALWIGMNETENRQHVLWQPRTWFNAYQWHTGFEGEVGTMFVHFPGLEGDRWNLMGRWLDILEGKGLETGPEKWKVELADTKYPQEIEAFWHAVRVGRRTLEAVYGNIGDMANAPAGVRVAVERLEYMMVAETDEVEKVMKAVKDVKDAVDRYEELQEGSSVEEQRRKAEIESREDEQLSKEKDFESEAGKGK